MAYPIKAISTLYGEEARRFLEMADETERKYDNTPWHSCHEVSLLLGVRLFNQPKCCHLNRDSH
jgi:hypothetical protein